MPEMTAAQNIAVKRQRQGGLVTSVIGRARLVSCRPAHDFAQVLVPCLPVSRALQEPTSRGRNARSALSGQAVPPAESRIEIVCRGGAWILTLHGEHDLATRPGLEEELERVAAAGGPIVVDLSPATFLDSSVIRAVAGRAQGDAFQPRVVSVVAPEATFAGRLAALVDLGAVVRVHQTLGEALRGGSRR